MFKNAANTGRGNGGRCSKTKLYLWSGKVCQRCGARLLSPLPMTLATKDVGIALSMFWKEIRKRYPSLQYWGVTEYNQLQTQPHFHFILGDDKYIPQPVIKEIWEKVQRWAGFESIAWNVLH
jgi:hypothetical protein